MAELCEYLCYFNGKKIVVQAYSALQARDKAVEIFKPSKSQKHMVMAQLNRKVESNVTVAIDTSSLG